MLPLSDWPVEERRGTVGVMADIDDTLTTEGRITADALAALGRLRAAGLHLVLNTGRPAGWSEPFARDWPVDAIVAENGAVALLGGPHPYPLPLAGEGVKRIHQQDAATRTALPLAGEGVRKGDGVAVRKIYQQDAATRSGNAARLRAVAQRILREVAGARLAQDSAGRETDIAIDHGEFTQLPKERIEQVLRIMQDEGMNASVSSIHINGWYGSHHKWSGACWIVRQLWQRELIDEIERWVYVGDSSNDQIMFQHFKHSAGVANIRRFAADLQQQPRYVTLAERGAGFAELVDLLLQGHGAT